MPLDAGKLWRAEADMKAHMSRIFAGQFLVALAFTMLWARIALGGAGLPCAIALGVFMGLAYSGSAVIQAAVQPLPHLLVVQVDPQRHGSVHSRRHRSFLRLQTVETGPECQRELILAEAPVIQTLAFRRPPMRMIRAAIIMAWLFGRARGG